MAEELQVREDGAHGVKGDFAVGRFLEVELSGVLAGALIGLEPVRHGGTEGGGRGVDAL